jgi:dTDP-glucose pyrophosphorylase
MIDVDNKKLTLSSTIKEAFKIVDDGPAQIAVVVDSDDILIGTITDGDLRRAILSGKTLKDEIQDIFNSTPSIATINSTKEEIINICTSNKIHQIPVVDSDGKIVGIDVFDDLIKPEHHNNKVILMVGGLGTRLRPLTETTPKSMLPVGGKPILQTIVEKFVSYGYVNIIMCVGYKSEVIQEFFDNGSKFGANIEYILESNRMGTIGALGLLNKDQKPNSPFFVMNGDLLTNVNFEHLMNFHLKNNSKATMCIREYDFQVPYGVVSTSNEEVVSIKEKPIHSFFVNAGIYILEPECIDLIPNNEFYDIPSLFDKLLNLKEKITPFPLQEYWIDIGRLSEYEKANQEYSGVFDI